MFFIYFDNSTDHTDRILIFQIEFCWKRFFIIVMLEICRKMNTTFGPKHMIFRVVIRKIFSYFDFSLKSRNLKVVLLLSQTLYWRCYRRSQAHNRLSHIFEKNEVPDTLNGFLVKYEDATIIIPDSTLIKKKKVLSARFIYSFENFK